MIPKFTQGGRGKLAPYKSTHCRVPEPIKPLIDTIIEAYKVSLQESSDGGKDFVKELNDFIKRQNQCSDKQLNVNFSENELISIASHILKQKKSAKVSLEKLLTTIFDKEISVFSS